MTAPALVYSFCFITCGICAWLLIRSWFKTRTRLLLWIAISFVLLAVNNFFLLADNTLLPHVDFSIYRSVSAVVAVSVLIFGLIWESE
jgi:hypothetical protein